MSILLCVLVYLKLEFSENIFAMNEKMLIPYLPKNS